MTRGIDGLGNINPSLSPTADAPGQTGAHGTLRGEKVATLDLNSLIADSKEELPAHLGETASKKLAERTAATKSGSRIREIIAKYAEAMGKGTEKNMPELLDSLKNMRDASPQQLKEKLQQFLKQADGEEMGGGAATLLALEEAFGTEPGSEAILSAIRDVKSELGSELAKFYQEHVQSFEGANEVYKQLIGQHGESDFITATEMMIKKLGTDVQAQGRTMEPGELKTRLDSLYHLEVARNTYLAFSQLLDKVSNFQIAG